MNSRGLIALLSALTAQAGDSPLLSDPFDPQRLRQAPSLSSQRRQDALEHYELSQLRMVGTLSSRRRAYALVQDPQQRVYLVAVGSLIGPDHGVVVRIREQEILLRETVSAESGRRVARSARLGLGPP